MGEPKKYRMFVWKEPGWDEGEELSWRAQVYDAKNTVTSLIGAGPTREAAIKDCLHRFAPPEPEGEWLTLEEAREIVSGAAVAAP
jgi:hypothetical protein